MESFLMQVVSHDDAVSILEHFDDLETRAARSIGGICWAI